MSKVENGNTVAVHYTGTLNDGNQFDSSVGKEPLTFEIGSGQVISGFESNIVGMTVGETKTFTLDPENAYGPLATEAIHEVTKNRFPDDFEVKVGEFVRGQTQEGVPFSAKIVSEQAETITLDFNHPLAGQDLTFEVELLTIA